MQKKTLTRPTVGLIKCHSGLGAYYFYKPFKQMNLVIVPSIRYWPTVKTSLSDDKFTFSNGDEHKAHEFGLFGNVSIGWSF
jgi:CRISPR/Cas system-associated protein Csm6